jgi:dipeptidyl-peptidase-4
MQIDLYILLPLKKLATLIDTKEHKGLPAIDGYTFDSTKK